VDGVVSVEGDRVEDVFDDDDVDWTIYRPDKSEKESAVDAGDADVGGSGICEL
jgi:hypothetical protein